MNFSYKSFCAIDIYDVHFYLSSDETTLVIKNTNIFITEDYYTT